jgi:hypothetical protein
MADEISLIENKQALIAIKGTIAVMQQIKGLGEEYL